MSASASSQAQQILAPVQNGTPNLHTYEVISCVMSARTAPQTWRSLPHDTSPPASSHTTCPDQRDQLNPPVSTQELWCPDFLTLSALPLLFLCTVQRMLLLFHRRRHRCDPCDPVGQRPAPAAEHRPGCGLLQQLPVCGWLDATGLPVRTGETPLCLRV